MDLDNRKSGNGMRHTYKKWLQKGIAIATVFSIVIGSTAMGQQKAFASEKTTTTQVVTNNGKEKASLRFVFTTDIHGMISSKDYEAGTDFKNAGLSRAYDLIKKARKEMPANNVYTFDIGDVLFDATTEYIMEQDSEVVQPIYQAMSLIGYDAITLGNHEFDYGKDYLLAQLYGSGLYDKVVVSNLFNTKDDSYPFERNMLITREVETNDGNTMEVTIGIIGETVPTLSSKTQNYTGTWKTEDIVQNTKKEAAHLKSLGADIIVVLAHSGFGDEEPEENAANAVYALSKLDDVDVILCGHEHNEFPSSNKSLYYYSLPGVDEQTGKVNGKTVVMSKNLGRSIGVVDITVEQEKDKSITITDSTGEVRKVTSTNTSESPEILACFANWKEEFEAYRNKQLAVLAEGEVLENYFGLLEDNKTLQMQNEARISYALRYIMKNKNEYAKYPILSASSYTSYGANATDDFVNITGTINQGDLVSIQNYRQYTSIYKITGAQLKEWLEWSASAYQTLGNNKKWSDEMVNSLKDRTSLSMLLDESWANNWGNFYMFEGIQYKIDPSVEPRYNVSGKKISNSKRITSLTYNGKQIGDSDTFVIACNTLSSSFAPLSWANSQLIYGKYRTQNIMAEYLELLGKAGQLKLRVDNNWSLVLPYNYKFLMKSPTESQTVAKKSDWYINTLETYADYNYYSAKYVEKQEQTEANIVIAPFTTDPSKSSFDVYVEASAPAGVKKVCYYPGVLDINDSSWSYMREVTNKKFTAYVNATYSILVEDMNGARTLRTFVIDNIGVDGMVKPKVKSVNNRSKAVTGTAEANTEIVVETADKTYTTTVRADGTFSCSIGAQNFGSTIYVYGKDDSTNRKSEKVKLSVRRASSNQPTVEAYYNNSKYLSGNTNDSDTTIAAFVDELRRVYVASEKDKEVLLQSAEYTVTDYSINVVGGTVDENGQFNLNLPEFEIGTTVTVYGMDIVGRLSRAVSLKVLDGGPYRPEINAVYEVEKGITGSVKSSKADTVFTVYAIINGNTYQTKTDSSGVFELDFNEQLRVGDTIEVYATDTVKNAIRTSATAEIKVESIETIPSSGEIQIGKFSSDVSKISIQSKPNEEICIAVPSENGNDIIYAMTDKNGTYVHNLSDSLKSGLKVYVYTRFKNGDIIDIATQMVPYAQPAKPKLIGKISNINKQVQIMGDEYSKIILTIGDKTYTSEQGVYNESVNGYVHTFTIAKAMAGTPYSFYAQNLSSKSSVVKWNVAKVAPDILSISELKVGTTEITGHIEIFSKDKQNEATVKSTKSKVIVKVNAKKYLAKVNEDGTFTVTIPELKAGDAVSIWASNQGGIGTGITSTIASK